MSSYRIERLIGAGGMAMVYRARRLLPGGHELPVACKLMHEERHPVPFYRELVAKEAALGLQVTGEHPHLVRVLDFFEDTEGRLCTVLELVEGGTVSDLRRAYRQLPFAVTRRIALDMLEALVHLHGRDVLHRDLSPCNVLVSTAGAVKVSDLGLAKLMAQGGIQTGTFRGKLFYASPESLQCLRLDARSDLYSLGAVLHELLAGTPPYGEEREVPRLVIRMSREEMEPLPAHVPDDLAALTRGLLRTDPDARVPQTAAEAIALLRSGGQSIASRADLASLMAALAHPDEIRGATSLRALAPGTILIPRALQPQPGAQAAPLPGPRRTADMPAPEQGLRLVVGATSTRTRDPFPTRGGRLVRVAALLAAGFVLGSLLHGRFWPAEDAAETRPVRALVQPSEPAAARAECAPATVPAEPAADDPAADDPVVVAPAAKEATQDPPAQRRPERARRQRATPSARRKPKNVAPLAKIPR